MYFSIPVSLLPHLGVSSSPFSLRSVSKSKDCMKPPLHFITAGQTHHIPGLIMEAAFSPKTQGSIHKKGPTAT